MGACDDLTEESSMEVRGRPPERTGVVVIRVWLESADAERGLRARISLFRDVACGDSDSVVAGSRQEILDAVRCFLDEFLG